VAPRVACSGAGGGGGGERQSRPERIGTYKERIGTYNWPYFKEPGAPDGDRQAKWKAGPLFCFSVEGLHGTYRNV